MTRNLTTCVSTRQVGQSQVTLVCEMAGPGPIVLTVGENVWRGHIPEAGADGVTAAAMTMAIVQRDDAIILIDCGLDDPGSRLRREVESEYPYWRHGPGLQAVLDHLSITNDRVTHVLLTHAHFDHCLGVAIETDDGLRPRFPRARYLLGRADWLFEVRELPPPAPNAEEVFVRWTRQEMWPRDCMPFTTPACSR